MAVHDEVAKEIREAFEEDSSRYGGGRSAADEYSIGYEGFVDVDGYNNPASYGDNRRE